MKPIAFAVFAFLAGVQASTAATYQFTLDNQTASDVAKFTVRGGGKIEGSTRVPSHAKRTVKVTLPDGKCRAEFRIDFESPYWVDDDKVLDLCKYGGLTIR